MVELNPQALLAALEANHAHKADPGRKGCGIEKAIRAYFAALPAPDDGLVEKLREACTGHRHAKIEWPHRLLHDAIAALQSKDEQIERQKRSIQELEESVSALEAERQNIIATKREQIERLTQERDEAREKALKQHGRAETYLNAAVGWERRAEAAEARVKELEEEVANLRAATNQSRLAFSGMVSVQSAIDLLDTLGGSNG